MIQFQMYADNRLIHENRFQTKEEKKLSNLILCNYYMGFFFLIIFFMGLSPLIYSRKYFLPRREPNFR